MHTHTHEQINFLGQVRMPAGDAVFTVQCESCAEKIATSVCLECDQLHCADCSRVLHKRGGRRDTHQVGAQQCFFWQWVCSLFSSDEGCVCVCGGGVVLWLPAVAAH